MAFCLYNLKLYIYPSILYLTYQYILIISALLASFVFLEDLKVWIVVSTVFLLFECPPTTALMNQTSANSTHATRSSRKF